MKAMNFSSTKRNRLTIYLQDYKLTQLDQLAAWMGESRSVVIRKAINILIEANKSQLVDLECRQYRKDAE